MPAAQRAEAGEDTSLRALEGRRSRVPCHADADGRLTGPDAVKFFERSGLPREQLAKVWALADNARRGYLDKTTFAHVRVSQ